MARRLSTKIGGLTLPNPVISGSGEPVMTESGIRAALAAGAAGVIAKSVDERPEAARQLDSADHIPLDVDGARSLFNRSGLTFRETGEWFSAIAAIDRDAARTDRFVATSIVLAGAEGAVRIAAMARDAGLRVFELNVGAPHASEAAPGTIVQETDPARSRGLMGQVRAATAGMAPWVKLTGLSSSLPALAAAARTWANGAGRCLRDRGAVGRHA
jgi:dihydroorotate dehydrogenase (NAD+) catalytic subunit